MSSSRFSPLLPWIFPATLLAAGSYLAWAVLPVPVGATGARDVRERVASRLREAEPGFRRSALETFPGDPWSQDDAFAASESGLVEQLANENQLRIGAVLDAVDADVKRRPRDDLGNERGRVAPCMPRPFYD